MAAALARLGLRAVKEVRIQFCPFEKNVESTRYGVVVRGAGRKGTHFCPAGGLTSLRPSAYVAFPPQDLPPGGEQREGPLHQLELLSDCGREARRLRALRGRAFRWARVGSRAGGAAGSLRPLGPVVLLVPDSFVSSPGDGHRLILRGTHLTAQEMLTAFASHIQARGVAGSGDKSDAGAGR